MKRDGRILEALEQGATTSRQVATVTSLSIYTTSRLLGQMHHMGLLSRELVNTDKPGRPGFRYAIKEAA